tara:strand:+ start:2039 stop:4204 length:2166 start_codon:yes stop_codon:yes gene_type:complete
MAYKFQRGSAILSGALLQEGNVELASGFEVVIGNASLTEAELEMLDGVSAGTVAASKVVVVDSNKDVTGYRNVTGTGAITAGTSFIIGSADLNEADMEQIDGITAGTAAASKALVLDSNKDASGIRNVGAVQLTTSGRVIVDDATEATSTTDGSLQTDGGLSVAKSAVIGDDLDLLSDAALLNFGADKDVSLTHVADTGLLLNSSRQLQFGDSGTYIHQSADGVLDLVADTEIEINATTVDINGAIDASSTIVAASSITAGTSFVIGSADLNEADMEKLDGITNGTAAASKAVVLDANKDVSGLRDISGRKATLSSLTQGRLVTAGSSGLLEDQAELVYDDAREDGYLSLMVSSSASGSVAIGDGMISIEDASANPVFQVVEYSAGNAEMGFFVGDTAAPAAVAVAADLVLFQDASDDTRMKKESLGDIRDLYFSAVSGDATIAAGGALTIAAGAVEHGMLAEDIISGQAALGGATVAQADLLMLDDGPGTVKKVTFSNFEDSIFGNVSGDATIAAGGALTIANDAVESGMLNDNVISGQTELAADGLAAADELLISDGGTLKKIGVDNLFLDGPGLLGEEAVAVGSDYIMFLDGGATGDAKKESIADLVTAMAGAGLSATSGVLAVQGNSVALKADGDTLAEGYNYFADISAGNVGVDLPASPSVGDVVHVKAGNITNSRILRISCQGSHTVDGETTIDLESPFAAVSLVYVVANNWRIV